ncbi:MAG TPA: hypothetical protein DCZ94_10250 [Lentisphaeria bacterium]|nr:MAG: hypothetical protein A2X48_11125 [Lentisphaerae bacterium GWF2_49_21]HBC87325.1 hypothetical protein [Lentisphaeria bacterium]
MNNKIKISFGDNVKILDSPETDMLGLSGKKGQVYGETTPSVTNVKIIGKTEEDYAINVFVDEIKKDYWFASHLLEFIDHGAGTEIVIGNHRAIRKTDGSWDESKVNSIKKWWQFWK